jgi:two-component system chemotaxis response regulator CheB
MPKLDGAKAVEAILKSVRPLPAVVMVSAYTKEGAEETLRSLRAGAVDFVLKPSGEISFDLKSMEKEILNKVKAASIAKVRRFEAPEAGTAEKSTSASQENAQPIVIGASTGGPPIIETIFAAISPSINAVFFVVQHMPPYFTKTFSEHVDRICPLKVKEAEDGDVVRGGMVFIAAGGFHMKIEKKKIGAKLERVIRMGSEAPVHGLRPAIDITMESAAASYKIPLIGGVLSGMGSDGSKGAGIIKAAGGRIFVQDPATAVIDAMPNAVIESGFADEILPPLKIAPRLAQLCA